MHRRVTATLVDISRELARATAGIEPGAPVAYVYRPLEYAWVPHEMYLSRWGGGRKEALLLGMNPGPFGMAQTGVPFGDPTLVREFLRIEGAVTKPAREHPKRPVVGLRSTRSEVSGQRLWGWARERFETPERFFARFFVVNYCPLAFMDEGGRNVTPVDLDRETVARIEHPCDAALRSTVELLAPRYVIGVGEYARKRAERALAGSGVTFGTILHPSPASPKANRGWATEAERQLEALGLELPESPGNRRG